MLKNEGIAWIDVENKTYTMCEITDNHLINIIKFLSNGNDGHEDFVTKEVILDLLSEVERRNLWGLFQ